MNSQSIFSKIAAAAILTGALALAGCSSTASSSNNSPDAKVAPKPETKVEAEPVSAVARSRDHVTRSGEVYLMRGLLDVFSRGMDTMAARMRAKGFDAISYNHSNWQAYADDIVARARNKQVSYPIIIMGHSLGGNAAPQMANYLGSRGIKTSLVVTFDPTEHQVIGKNVGTVINYYLPNGRNKIDQGSGFSGNLQNVNVSNIPGIEHTNVEKNTGLQNKSIDRAIKLSKPIKNQTASKRKNSTAS